MDPFSAIALDIGSTSIKCAGLNASGEMELLGQALSPQLSHESERVWGDPKAYASVCQDLLQLARERTHVGCPLAITCQRSTFVVWNHQGRLLSPLISWQDRFYGKDGLVGTDEKQFQSLSGLVPSPYYLGPKLKGWLYQNNKQSKEVLVGTLDTYLVWLLSQRRHFVMDCSMAARTGLLSLETGEWSEKLLAMFKLDRACLPSVVPTMGLKIDLQGHWSLNSMSADQSASLKGHDPEPGDICINFGTGVFVMKVLQNERDFQQTYQNALFYEDIQKYYFCEGAINGLTRTLESQQVMLDSSHIIENEAFCLVDSSGLGAPHWRPDLGFTTSLRDFSDQSFGLRRSIIIEGLVFRVYEIIQDLADQNSRILVSGGASQDQVLISALASLCTQNVLLTEVHESSLRGALKFLKAPVFDLGFHEIPCKPDPYLERKFKVWNTWKLSCLN